MPSHPEITAMAELIFADLLAEQVLSTTIEAHREIKRGLAVCSKCGTRCRSHAPINPPSTGSSLAASRESSPTKMVLGLRPQGYGVGPEKGTGGGTGVGSGSGKMDGSGNAFFDCLVCGRSITSSRYAPHLASCLGLSGSTRRGASRMAAAKARMGANDRASPSPYLASEDSDAESASGRGKKKPAISKRAASPSKSLLAKKAKLNNVHSGSAPPSSRPAHPSRLGRPSTKAHSSSPAHGASRNGSGSPEKAGSVPPPARRGGTAEPVGRGGGSALAKSASMGSFVTGGGLDRSASPASTSGGMVGSKSLPGAAAASQTGQVDGDDSSEVDDDY